MGRFIIPELLQKSDGINTDYRAVNEKIRTFFNTDEYYTVVISYDSYNSFDSAKDTNGIHARYHTELRKWIEDQCRGEVILTGLTKYHTYDPLKLKFELQDDLVLFRLSKWGAMLPRQN